MNNLVAFFISRSFLKNALIALGFLITAVLLLMKSLEIITRHGAEVEVPGVTGKQLNEAKRSLEERSFNVVVDSVFVVDKPGGTVIEQIPPAGYRVKENRTVYLTMVTYTAPSVRLPKFEDTPYREYESVLKGTGLNADSVVYQHDVARDLVLGVTYKGARLTEGSLLPKGAHVGIVLGDGSGGELVLPNLIGLNLADAKFAIRGAELLLGDIVIDSLTQDANSARVYKQVPSFRNDSITRVPQGTVISIYLKNP